MYDSTRGLPPVAERELIDVLVQITTDSGGAGAITLNGANVTSAFRPGSAPNTLVGLVTGLNLGRNTLADSE